MENVRDLIGIVLGFCLVWLLVDFFKALFKGNKR
jgi:hypothetical protein